MEWQQNLVDDIENCTGIVNRRVRCRRGGGGLEFAFRNSQLN
jgi:hypothetical protein